MSTPERAWVEAFMHAARCAVPVIVRVRTPRGDATLRDVVVVRVAIDSAMVRSRLDKVRFNVVFADILGVFRLDGRPFNPRPRGEPDGRAALAERGEEMLDAGGLDL